MDNFVCKATHNTPFVRISYDEGQMDISGRSSPEHTLEFYQPVMDTIAKFVDEKNDSFEANFKYVYFNTSSARCVFLIIKELKKLEDAGKDVVINWIASEDDEDMQETGIDYQEIVGMRFNIKLIPAEEDDY